jgi:hypothetical protein
VFDEDRKDKEGRDENEDPKAEDGAPAVGP